MSSPRLHVPDPLGLDLSPGGAALALPAVAARHAQVLRLQPGRDVTLFDGRGGEWTAEVLSMGRGTVTVTLRAHTPVERELQRPVTLAVVMPANDRMDDLVEKATELGVAAIQPLVSERSVLRLSGERATRKVAHWQAVAAAACEQCGRNRVPMIGPVLALPAWLASIGPGAVGSADAGAAPTAAARWLLSTAPGHEPLAVRQARLAPSTPVWSLSGPEGGFSDSEEAAALAAGFAPLSLGPRILRADTAPLAVLAALALTESAAA